MLHEEQMSCLQHVTAGPDVARFLLTWLNSGDELNEVHDIHKKETNNLAMNANSF